MLEIEKHKDALSEMGFTSIENVFTREEVEAIISRISVVETSNETFRKSEDLFAIRQFLKELPECYDLILNENMKRLVESLFGDDFFVVKSIYFDKPPTSNWYVAYHQDLTISVDKKISLENFGSWTVKQNQFAVQPPIDILENIFTVRIHLDDTDENNGALRVVPGSHLNRIRRLEAINWERESEISCAVKLGGVMVMKPLLLHSSSRTSNGKRRRVIHIEFSNRELPAPLNWAERIN